MVRKQSRLLTPWTIEDQSASAIDPGNVSKNEKVEA